MPKADKPLPGLDYLLPRIRFSRILACASYAALLITLLIYNAFFAELHGANPIIIIGVQVVPLLIFLPGIVTGNPRVHAFLAFAINLYFIHGVLVCFQPGREGYGALLVAFSLLYFLAALGFVRWSFQAQRVRAGEI
ncbi:MAG TPA: DUF2069 domain-containing protein [Pseudomonas xinjiangensis]|uniref:DUF2069 domain-containing protein n=2 Tax=root TaxID=1 RepID=A0A7V1BPE9_9GAMM|nr:DUF2069 domain-containing protein [Halopseudomonas xinjiangensis]HEC47977.1 DUF2069 domain-containing protein [Halopseudomonas xinjiangensis]